MSKINNSFMNAFELQVTEFESTTDYLSCGAIRFKIKTDKGEGDRYDFSVTINRDKLIKLIGVLNEP